MKQALAALLNRTHGSTVASLVVFGTLAVLVGIHELPSTWLTVGIAALLPGVRTDVPV